MSFRFRRSFGNKFFRINLSKSGVSASTGVPGFILNNPLIGKRRRGQRLTVGLPGTGMSYSVQAKSRAPAMLAEPGVDAFVERYGGKMPGLTAAYGVTRIMIGSFFRGAGLSGSLGAAFLLWVAYVIFDALALWVTGGLLFLSWMYWWIRVRKAMIEDSQAQQLLQEADGEAAKAANITGNVTAPDYRGDTHISSLKTVRRF
jgi:hypothetical protein